MTIVLTILKVLLIIILSLLGLILLIVLLLLLCPFRYKLAGEYTDIIAADVAVRWLIAKVLVDFKKDEGLNYVVKVLGIPVYKGNVPLGSSAQEESDTGDLSGEDFDLEDFEESEESSEETSGESAEESTELSTDTVSEEDTGQSSEESGTTEEPASESDEESEATAETSESETEEGAGETAEEEKTVGEKISDKIDELSKKIEEFQKNKDEILTKLDHIKQFLEKDYVQNTIKRVFKMLKRFVISMRPRKGEGYIDIGLKSAYDTGNLMAMIAPYYPIYGNWLAVNPYFNEQKIEGKLSIKGRVFVCVIAFPAIGLVLTKDFRKTVALARKI